MNERNTTRKYGKSMTVEESKLGVTVMFKHNFLYDVGFKKDDQTSYVAARIRRAIEKMDFSGVEE